MTHPFAGIFRRVETVPRAMYDAVVVLQQERSAQYREEIARLASLVGQERAAHERTLQKYHALKLNGASEPIPVAPLAKREPDLLKQAIIEKAGGNTQLLNRMMGQLAIDRASGEEDDDILSRILNGETGSLEGVP